MTPVQDNKARRQLAAILSADAVGYSRRMAEDETATVQALRSHLETIGGFVREHRGLVVNAVGDGKAFEVDNNDGWLLAADGTESALQPGSKTLMASRIVDAIVTFLQRGAGDAT